MPTLRRPYYYSGILAIVKDFFTKKGTPSVTPALRLPCRLPRRGEARPAPPLVNDDEIGKSESRENLSSDEGTFSQEYFVYFKKK